MPAPQTPTRIRSTLLAPGEAEARRRAAVRRTVLGALGVVLLLGLPVHALANTTHDIGPTERVVIPLDRDFERTYTWRGTVRLAAPATTWVWPALHYSGEPIGRTDAQGVALPTIYAESYVDGELVTEWSFGGDFGAGFSARDTYGCRPRSACEWPALAWGFREVEVTVVAKVTHEGNPQARGLSQAYTLGPMEVILDRCPCW